MMSGNDNTTTEEPEKKYFRYNPYDSEKTRKPVPVEAIKEISDRMRLLPKFINEAVRAIPALAQVSALVATEQQPIASVSPVFSGASTVFSLFSAPLAKKEFIDKNLFIGKLPHRHHVSERLIKEMLEKIGGVGCVENIALCKDHAFATIKNKVSLEKIVRATGTVSYAAFYRGKVELFFYNFEIPRSQHHLYPDLVTTVSAPTQHAPGRW
ncbi:MAG: hypothetical protein NTU49_07400 [Gammaproteobacteria bacterium]|nr:hypothetical protein [Gammaproteobacteria bacterium]